MGIFRRKVQQGSESWMNVVFEVLGEGAEKAFLEGAEKQGMKGLKGHRYVLLLGFASFCFLTVISSGPLEVSYVSH